MSVDGVAFSRLSDYNGVVFSSILLELLEELFLLELLELDRTFSGL